MRVAGFLMLLLVVMPFAVSDASAHGGRARVGVHVGTYWGPWFMPPPWYYQPTIVVPAPQPTIYIEQGDGSGESLWYYCRSAAGYHPYVRECPEGWLKVLPEVEK
ncbi:MAG: hypothetical protein F9K30_09915 [Dechloromonas sp.]|nr:MAG: hypothetical protein F9K30_09915 [Dechloromonas sp.]